MVGLPQGGSVSWNLLLLAPFNYSCGMFDPNDRAHTFFSRYLYFIFYFLFFKFLWIFVQQAN
jgi:hypothetical protein